MRPIRIFFLFVVCLPVLGAGQTPNFKDEFGRKQGVHSGYSGRWLFERTYVNDTLNGFFRQYTKDGINWTTGYFKHGQQDSLWLDFYENGTIKKQTFYREGKKQGESIHYYENGQISYYAQFRNDSLIGDATNYFKNGAIKSQGNHQNGVWIEYYEGGNIKSKKEFSHGQLYGQHYFFTNDGDTLFPRFIKPEIVLYDTSVINNTSLKIYLLFDSYDSMNQVISPRLYELFDFSVCRTESLSIRSGTFNFKITPDGLLFYEKPETLCDENIPVVGYTTNRITKKRKNGEYKVSYQLEKKKFRSGLGKIEVERKQQQCDDTGKNPLRIIHDGKSLLFKDIGNLLFFEYDNDKDGETELYLLNYFTCAGHLMIYKIDAK